MTTASIRRFQPQQPEPQQTQPPVMPPAYTPSQSPAPSLAAQPGAFGRTFHAVTTKAGWPLNKAANVIGAEGWWPTTMAKECSKAARILHSFTNLSPSPSGGPLHPTGLSRKSMVKIPDAVLSSCAGLAIFNVLRAGAFHGSLAAGSGVVIARRPDGTWSPPSSFVVSTLGAGFVVGLDIYDCVCVLNTPAQVAAFTNPRVSLGGDASIAVGPLGAGASVDAALSRSVKPVWSYMKSRGLWAGVQIDGTVIVSRADANAAFYGRGIKAKEILLGDVAWPAGAQPLFNVLREIHGVSGATETGAVDGGMETNDEKVQAQVQTVVVEDEVPQKEEVAEGDKEETVMDEKERLKMAGY